MNVSLLLEEFFVMTGDTRYRRTPGGVYDGTIQARTIPVTQKFR